jgi:hypothetical protein
VRALALLVALAGCGPTALEFAQQSTTVAAQVEAAALPGIREVLDHREQALVDQARTSGATREATEAKVADFRATADKVTAGLHAFADAIRTAKAGIEAAQAGALSITALAPLLGKLFAVALDLAAQAKRVGITIPGLDKLIPSSVYSQPPPTARRLPARLAQEVA